MLNSDLQADVLTQLKTHYGSDRVVAEPRLEAAPGAYPDAVVYTDAEHTTPFLVVECSTLRTNHRADRDLYELVDGLRGTDARYGALIGPNVEFVFKSEGANFQTLGGYPDVNASEPTRRPFASREELEFVVDRCLSMIKSRQDGHLPSDVVVDEFFESLQLVLELQNRSDLQIPLDAAGVSTLYDELQSRYPWYRVTEPLDHEIVNITSDLFNGYDLDETSDNVLAALFDVREDKRGSEYATPSDVAQQLVRLGNFDLADEVLDPAAGQGTILSFATQDGAHGTGVEVNPSVLGRAAFFGELFDRELTLKLGDFFHTDFEEASLNTSYDTILIDPPFGMHVSGEKVPFVDDDRTVYSEEAFIAKALTLLEEDGTVTIVVSTGLLTQHRRAWLRELVLSEYQLDSIIQVRDGPIYRHTHIDTAILTISNQSPEPDHEVKYELVESPEEPTDALAESVTRIIDETAPTIPQSELNGSFDIGRQRAVSDAQTAVQRKFSSLAKLSEIADVRTGNPPEDLVDQPYEDAIRYLSIRDIGVEPNRHADRFIFDDNVRAYADETCVLVATIGEQAYIHVPTERVAPAQDLAILQFDSHDAAIVYERFLNSKFGQQALDALKTGTGPRSRIRIGDLKELLVPAFDDEELATRAEAVRDHQRRQKKLDEKEHQIQREQEKLERQADELLLGGGDDE